MGAGNAKEPSRDDAAVLVIDVLKDGIVVRQTRIPDPRQQIVDMFNRDMAATSYRMQISQSHALLS